MNGTIAIHNTSETSLQVYSVFVKKKFRQQIANGTH